MSDRPYPPIPKQAKTGLCLFGAYFAGENDGEHLRDAGLVGTVVDIDVNLLEAMRPKYPADWTFVCADAFEFARVHAAEGTQWDVVSVDPSRPEEPQVLEMVDTFDKLARMMLVIGHRIRYGPAWEQLERPLDSGEPWLWMIAHK